MKITMLGGVHINSYNTPIYNALKKYSQADPLSFHMPGHKMGKGIPPELLKDLAKMDLTEIYGMDNLHSPTGVIAKAQELAAQAFGADSTYFLVNGSTSGIMAMIMTMCKPGGSIIVGRDCHKSVIAGMILGGIRPIYIKPEYNSSFGIPGSVRPEDIKGALEKNPLAKGVLITSPNYYGICSEIEEIAKITHSYDKILAVDEAHGAHLKFNPSLPKGALEAGADICVQSAHKTLSAFTQGSYLHVNSSRIDQDRLRFNLSMLQTSSPSYIIMAFLDVARELMQRYGKENLDKLLEHIKWLEGGIDGFEGFRILKDTDIEKGSLDRTRLVINCSRLAVTGYDLEKKLRYQYGIQVEMSDIYNIVCIATAADNRRDFERLYGALGELDKNSSPSVDLSLKHFREIKISPQQIMLGDIGKVNKSKVALKSAAGRVSLGIITPYPPGIPMVCPGELITKEIIDYITNIIALGGSVVGVGPNLEIEVAS